MVEDGSQGAAPPARRCARHLRAPTPFGRADTFRARLLRPRGDAPRSRTALITPLLIDQPEDHLDSEFIFKAIVPALRRAKERRQVVLVTHNANVCVLGDAEQIVVLESVEDAGKVVNTGGIDSGDLKQEACRMLEGTEGAFKLRGLMYGMKVE